MRYVAPALAALRESESRGLPRRHVKVQSAGLQVVAVTDVGGRAELILETPLEPGQIGEGKPNVALAPDRRIVHCCQQPFPTGPMPGERQEAIPCPVAFPGRDAFEQLPTALAQQRLAEQGDQPVVQLR